MVIYVVYNTYMYRLSVIVRIIMVTGIHTSYYLVLDIYTVSM